MTKTEIARYPIEVFWSDEDEGYIAVAPDLPGAAAWGASEADALREIRVAIDGWIEAARAAGNPVPSPSDKSTPPEYSGKFMVRVPRSLHATLAKRAEQEGVSLNALAIHLLSGTPTPVPAKVETRRVPARPAAIQHGSLPGLEEAAARLIAQMQTKQVSGAGLGFLSATVRHGVVPHSYQIMPEGYHRYSAQTSSDADIDDLEIKGMLPHLVAGRAAGG